VKLVDGVPTNKHPLCGTFSKMIDRCHNPRSTAWRWYGGRGIKVCSRWRESFEFFVSDMGPKPSARHSLDRVDRDGDYEPGNVRWATRATQAANRRRSVNRWDRSFYQDAIPDRVRRQAWPDYARSNDLLLCAAYDALEDLVSAFGPVADDFNERVLPFGWGIEG